MGTNLSGLEWAAPGLRYGLSSGPNINITLPRKADVALLAASGFTRNRLPIQWELLQPMLASTVAGSREVSLIGAPGALHAGYASWIDSVLDAHAALGTSCIVDLHNYCRYQDFIYGAGGVVAGLTAPPDPQLRPYTSDNTQVRVRIMSRAQGATLSVGDFTDFWTRAAQRWSAHPGLAGFGLMNEPHDMPAAGSLDPSYGGQEDLGIWPLYAQAAIDAIRAVGQAAIYVSGNQWDSAMSLSSANPGYPLRGTNLVYEVHMYLDASSSGGAFDYDTEVAKGYSAGTSGSIGPTTGMDRLVSAVAWAQSNGARLALTETGMPIDDPRWADMFSRAIVYARSKNMEIYSWMGGTHWPIRAFPINHVPTWHQGRSALPQVAGPMLSAMGRQSGALFDEGPCFLAAGQMATRSVACRGYLAAPMTVSVSISGAGSLSAASVVLPVGYNTSASYQCSAPAGSVCDIGYAVAAGAGMAAPQGRRIFAGVDPVALGQAGAASAMDAALAKYGASRWSMADAFTEAGGGVACAQGDSVRAVHDGGYGSSVDNAQEMINWMSVDFPAMSSGMALPKMAKSGGLSMMDLSGTGAVGLWCKKRVPVAGTEPNPRNRVPFNLEDPHFCAVAIQAGQSGADGVVFQAGLSEGTYLVELRLVAGRARARWIDASGQVAQIDASSVLAAGQRAVVSMGSRAGAQWLRVGSVQQGSAGASFAASPCSQMLIGWGFVSYYPRDGFQGGVFGVVAGKGAPSVDELAVMERGLAGLAGL